VLAAIALVGGSLVLPEPAVPEVLAAAAVEAVPAPDLSDDMRPVDEADPLADAEADALRRESSRAAPTTNHLIFVSVVDVVTGSTAGELSSEKDLSKTAASAAVQKVSDYWYAETGGAISFSLGGYEHSSMSARACDTELVADNRAAKAFGGLFANQRWLGSNRHLLTLSQETTACGTEGFGTVGGRGGEIFSANGLDTAFGIPVLLHEIGHNIGFGHANTTVCTTGQSDGASRDFSYSGSVCPTQPYNDVLDIMGATVAQSTPHLSAIERIQFGYFEGSYVSPATKQTVTLAPLDRSSGVRAARIIDPLSGSLYVVEYRTSAGADAGNFEFTGADRTMQLPNGYRLTSFEADAAVGSVRILREIPTGDVGYPGERNYTETTALAAGRAGNKTDARSRHARLDPGETFTSFNHGFTVRVDAAQAATGATVSVSFPVHYGTSTTLTASRSARQTFAKPSRVVLTARVTSPNGIAPTGTVSFVEKGEVVASVAVNNGTAKFTLPRTLSAGKHAMSARFIANSTFTGSASASKTVTVKKAKATTTFRFAKKTIARSSQAKIKVVVRAPGVTKPYGKVVAYANGKKLKTYRLPASKKGKITLTLPKLAAGTKRITVKYTGNSNIAADKSVVKKLVVKR
jgi:hypothetical protein